MTLQEDQILSIYKNQISGSREKAPTLPELIFKIFEGKFVEIYTGDSYESVKFEQAETDYPAVFIGKVLGGVGPTLILNCVYKSDNGTISDGQIIFLNQGAIRAVSEVGTSNASIQEAMLLTNEAKRLFAAYQQSKANK